MKQNTDIKDFQTKVYQELNTLIDLQTVDIDWASDDNLERFPFLKSDYVDPVFRRASRKEKKGKKSKNKEQILVTDISKQTKDEVKRFLIQETTEAFEGKINMVVISFDESISELLQTILQLRRKQISEQEAEKIISHKDIRKHLCPALQSIADDAFEISKVVTPILVGLVIAGTIIIPLTPVLFAAIALVIARMGISSICADYNKENKD